MEFEEKIYSRKEIAKIAGNIHHWKITFHEISIEDMEKDYSNADKVLKQIVGSEMCEGEFALFLRKEKKQNLFLYKGKICYISVFPRIFLQT